MGIQKTLGALLVLAPFCTSSAFSAIISSGFNALLDTGSLSGTTFPVSFSYDNTGIAPTGDSFITLNSFDFMLLGTSFHKSDILQGGQVIFHNGTLNNVTASFQVILPPSPPVENITFGFGGPGVIGYIDNGGQSGTGSFTFTAAPEPVALSILLAAFPALLARRRASAFIKMC